MEITLEICNVKDSRNTQVMKPITGCFSELNLGNERVIYLLMVKPNMIYVSHSWGTCVVNIKQILDYPK